MFQLKNCFWQNHMKTTFVSSDVVNRNRSLEWFPSNILRASWPFMVVIKFKLSVMSCNLINRNIETYVDSFGQMDFDERWLEIIRLYTLKSFHIWLSIYVFNHSNFNSFWGKSISLDIRICLFVRFLNGKYFYRLANFNLKKDSANKWYDKWSDKYI